MERRTFLTSAGALGLLSSFVPLKANSAWFVNGHTSLTGRGEPLQTESADLSPYTGAWGDTQLRHLLRRAMFGVPQSQFDAAKALGSMNAVVSKLLEAQDVNKVPLPPPPASWVNGLPTDPKVSDPGGAVNLNRLYNTRIVEIGNWWFDLMVQENLSIREKMTLLWTNHFVTGSLTVQHPGYMYTYLQTCRQYALGNFKNFAYAISIDPAMLIYLNGNQNYIVGTKSYANENYARELMELFTLGILDPKTGLPNYTETDIQNSARALTGWKPTVKAPFIGWLQNGVNTNPDTGTVPQNEHDTGTKTFLGQTGNWGLQDILNIIFQQGTPPGYTSAYFVCQKLYEEFVYYIPNPSVVDAMAQLMLANNFEIAPVMQALLTSAHFYDPNVIGAQLKSPAMYAGSLVREFGLTYPAFDPTDPPIKSTDPNTHYNTYTDTNPTLTLITQVIMANAGGQQLLNPPNVKGWPGGHNWISTGTFQARESESYIALNNGYVNTKSNINLAFNADMYARQIQNAAGLSSQALSQALEDLSLAFTLGPLEAGDLQKDISATYPDPNYKYDPTDVKGFAVYLTSLPEFQLY